MNCIWITTDSFRQDHIHCYRPEGTIDDTGESIKVQTPSMDRLAAEGVMFTRLRSESLPTVPCRRGTFTGRRVFPFKEEAPMKGMYIHAPGWRPIPQQDVTVAEHLTEQGYVTGMVCDVYHLMKPSQNFHRGFQSFNWVRGQEYDQWHSQPLPEGYIEQFLKPSIKLEARRSKVLNQYLKNQFYRKGDDEFQAARTFRTAIDWLEQNHAHEKFFLYVDSFDPHEPNEAPKSMIDLYDPGYDGPQLIYGNIYKRSELTDAEHHHVRSGYAAACTMVDHWIGKLLDKVDELGLAGNTIVIVVSDHGKILGEFGHYGMPPQDTGPALSPVPCFIRHPQAQNSGKRFDGWLYNTDVVVTMLNMMGVEPKPRTDGQDVWPAVCNSNEFRDHLVTGHCEMVAAWREDWLYLHNAASNSGALYNLADDVYRKHDVADKYPAVRDDLKRMLNAAC